MKTAIQRPNVFTVRNPGTGELFYGCNQAWYGDEWQRRAGCGPSVASHLFAYSCGMAPKTQSQSDWLTLMEDVWNYVTPTDRGMPTTQLFCDSALAYAQARGFRMYCKVSDVPEVAVARPSLSEVVRFVAEALQSDAPVAFLNLCNGEEQCLYRWHWVTIIALDFAPDGSRVAATILDEGRQLDIDLAIWHKTTTLGGGFVRFVPT
jgi:hypothetical protein